MCVYAEMGMDGIQSIFPVFSYVITFNIRMDLNKVHKMNATVFHHLLGILFIWNVWLIVGQFWMRCQSGREQLMHVNAEINFYGLTKRNASFNAVQSIMPSG